MQFILNLTCDKKYSQKILCLLIFAIKIKSLQVVFTRLGQEFLIEPRVKVVCTPGHTADSVSVMVQTGNNQGLVAITGDLFEREADIEFPVLWRETAGSQDPETQKRNRDTVLKTADWIVPGHGPMFQNIYKERLLELWAWQDLQHFCIFLYLYRCGPSDLA